MKRLLCLLLICLSAFSGYAKIKKNGLEVYLDKVIRESHQVKELKIEDCYTYTDELIVFTSVPVAHEIYFSIRNKTESSFVILLGKVVYKDHNGESPYIMPWDTRNSSKDPGLDFSRSFKKTSSAFNDRRVNSFIFERRYNQDIFPVNRWFNKVLFYYGRIQLSNFFKMVRKTTGWTINTYAGELTLKILLAIQLGDDEYNYQFFFKARPKNGEG